MLFRCREQLVSEISCPQAQQPGAASYRVPMTTYSWYVAVSLAAAACFSVTAHASVSQTDVFINEIHYDNTGADAGESVELAGPAGVTLDGLSLHFYNGNGGGQYSTTSLAGTLPAMQSGYGVLSFATSGLQNGPDGIALVRDSDASVLQFLSYEGTITATDGPAIGLTAVDINVAQTSSTPVSESLQLCGSGSNSTDFGWSATAMTASFGSVNSCQSFEQSTVTTCIDLKRLFRNNSCCGNATKGINLHFVDIGTVLYHIALSLLAECVFVKCALSVVNNTEAVCSSEQVLAVLYVIMLLPAIQLAR